MILGLRKADLGVEAARQSLRTRRAPETDWREPLWSRFGVDAERSPAELDGTDYREPDPLDTADMAHALAVVHMPLWRITPDEARLFFVNGFDSSSVFRLALLMLEKDPWLQTEGASFGPMLPAAGGMLVWDYDPVRDRARSGGEEDHFRGSSIGDIVHRLRPRSERELDIVADTAVALAPPRRFAETSGTLRVRQVGNRVVVQTRRDPGGPNVQETPAVRIFLVGRRDANRLWAVAVHDDRPFARFGNYFSIGLEGAKLGLEEEFGLPTTGWTDFE